MDEKINDYYALFDIEKQFSQEEILAAWRRRLPDIERWKAEKMPPDERKELMELYKRAIFAICEDQGIPPSRISPYLQGHGYFEDPFEKERGIPVIWASMGVVCLAVYFLFKNEFDTSSLLFATYCAIFATSFILHCLSGGRSLEDALNLRYPVNIRYGDNNTGKRFIEMASPISIVLFLLFLLEAIGGGDIGGRTLSTWKFMIAVYAIASIADLIGGRN